MDKSIKDIRKFVIKQMLSANWSSEGRSNYYTNKHIILKKDFDESIWLFSLETGTFHSFENLSIGKLLLFILLFFVRRSDKKRKEDLKSEKLRNEWSSFLKKNKDIDRDSKINKIIND